MTTEALARTMKLRVLTANIWGTEGEPDRQELLRDAIIALDPDLIALQEVARSDAFDQLAFLLDGTGLYGTHGWDVIDAPWTSSVGSALVSRWKPASVVGAMLPATPWVGQDALAATIRLPIGVDVLFVAVKPSWQLDHEADRCRQALAIDALDNSLRQAAPTILAGDFDATPEADCMRFYTGRSCLEGRSVHFRDAWEQAGDGGPGYTWTTDNPFVASFADSAGPQTPIIEIPHHRRIDHILVGSPHAHPDVSARILRCEVVLADPPASDHRGVLAEIELTNHRHVDTADST